MDIILIAFAADLWLGDPLGRYHPVRAIGWLIAFQERLYRRWFTDLHLAGFFLLFITVAAVCAVGFGVRYALAQVHVNLAALWDILLIFFSLSVKGLGDEAMAVHRAISNGNVEYAKQRLAMLVGRDTDALDESGIARATVETVSENLVDGVLSPLLFAVIGGGPLAMAYKAVNTLDSMVGYKDERYERLGRASALADDAANFIPARLSLPLTVAAAFLLDYNWRAAWRIALRDRRNHASPNAAHPEAAFSGAFNIVLGGSSTYRGETVEKPLIGEGQAPPLPAHIPDAVRLMRITALLGLAAFVAAGMAVRGLW